MPKNNKTAKKKYHARPPSEQHTSSLPPKAKKVENTHF